MLSEPLSLLVFLFSLVLSVLAPAFHYHQFGEATRMARDAGISSLFLGGTAMAVFGTIRVFRREIESGTLDMALSHPVSRAGFFLAKVAGCLVAYAFFALTLGLVVVTMVNGAAIGGVLADRNGDIARIWGPSLAMGISAALVPLVAGAALNRFARCRFVFSAFAIAGVVALGGAAYRFDFALAWRLVPVMVLASALSVVMLAAAAAFAVRFRANAAASASGLVVLALIPFVGNYYLPDALSKGGFLPWSYVLCGLAAALPAALGFLVAGVGWMNRVER